MTPKTARRASATTIEEHLNASGEAPEFSSPWALLSFALLCLLLVAAPFSFSGLWQASIDVLGGDALVPQTTFLSLTAVSCFLLALSGAAKPPRSALAMLIGAFFVWCTLSVLGTVYLHDSLIELSRFAGLTAWFYLARTLLYGQSAADAARRLCLLGAIVLGADIVCGIALLTFLQDRNPRQFSTFFNPNLLANYCALALPLCLALLLNARKNAALLLFSAASLLVIFGGLAVTSSKGGFLSALIALLIFTVATWRARGRRGAEILRAHRKTALVGAVVICLLGGVLLQKTLLPRLRAASGGADNSTMFRVYTWRGTAKMAQARPLLGWGPGSYPSAYPQFAITGYTRTAHQIWLQLAAESGLPAALLLLSACGAGALCGWRALKISDDWPVAAGGVGAVAAFVAHGCTDAGWSLTSIALLLIIALALLDSLRDHETKSEQTEAALNYSWLCAALFFGILAAGTFRAVNGEDAVAKSRELLAKGAPESALQIAQEGTQTDALNARLWHNLGRVQEAIGQNGNEAFARAAQLQPTKAAHYLNGAKNERKAGNTQQAARLYDAAIAMDANDTNLRLSRADFLFDAGLPQAQERAWRDYEHVAALYDAPYGKYPAIAEMVNLDFPRAFLKLGERALKAKNKAQAANYASRGLEILAIWHANAARNREIAGASGEGGAQFEAEAREVADLEEELNNLKARAK